MGKVDRFIVPATFVIALVAVLSVTISWVPRPYQPISLVMSMGPPRIVPGRPFGLRFTPRNALSGHILTHLVPPERRCVDVTITDASLTYFDQRKACRLWDGSYKLPYTFPHFDDYVIFVEMQPVGGLADAHRVALPLDACTLRMSTAPGTCAPQQAALRGLEVVRSHTVDGVTVVLGAPAHAVQIEQQVQITFVFLRNDRTLLGLEPIDGAGGAPGRAVAVSMDTLHFTQLYPDPDQVVGGHVKGGVVSFSGWFGRPGIYRVFGAFRYQGHPLRTSFVIDVNPKPTPTPAGA